MSIKTKLQSWLEIKQPKEQTEFELRKMIGEEFANALSGKSESFYAIVYGGSFKNTLERVIDKVVMYRIQNAVKEAYDRFSLTVDSEKFITDVINRINNKQLR